MISGAAGSAHRRPSVWLRSTHHTYCACKAAEQIRTGHSDFPLVRFVSKGDLMTCPLSDVLSN